MPSHGRMVRCIERKGCMLPADMANFVCITAIRGILWIVSCLCRTATAAAAAAASSAAMASFLPRTPQRRASTDSSATATSTATSSPGGGLSGRARLQTLAIDALLSSTMASVSATPPRLPVAKNKEPLSLPTTTRNFRGFVQKSGPIFYFQDAVEATLAWDDWAWTVMWMGLWAVVGAWGAVTRLKSRSNVRWTA